MDMSEEYSARLTAALKKTTEEISSLSESEFQEALKQHAHGDIGKLLLHAGCFDDEFDGQYETTTALEVKWKPSVFIDSPKNGAEFQYAMAA